MANKPHIHAAVIKAWADGAEIEVQGPCGSDWFSCFAGSAPSWAPNCQYRVKPEPHRWQAVMDAYYNDHKDIQCRCLPNSMNNVWQDWPGANAGKHPRDKRFDDFGFEFRIKPVEEVRYMRVCNNLDVRFALYMLSQTPNAGLMCNLKLTFEDDVLLKAEVVK